MKIPHPLGADSMEPTLLEGGTVPVDMARRTPNPPGAFVIRDGIAAVAKRLEHVPNSDPPRVRTTAGNPRYAPCEGVADEINVVGRIRWFAREL